VLIDFSFITLSIKHNSDVNAAKKRAEAEKRKTRRPMPKSHEHLRNTWASSGWAAQFPMLT